MLSQLLRVGLLPSRFGGSETTGAADVPFGPATAERFGEPTAGRQAPAEWWSDDWAGGSGRTARAAQPDGRRPMTVDARTRTAVPPDAMAQNDSSWGPARDGGPSARELAEAIGAELHHVADLRGIDG
jgi:hypothetical protein